MNWANKNEKFSFEFSYKNEELEIWIYKTRRTWDWANRTRGGGQNGKIICIEAQGNPVLVADESTCMSSQNMNWIFVFDSTVMVSQVYNWHL